MRRVTPIYMRRSLSPLASNQHASVYIRRRVNVEASGAHIDLTQILELSRDRNLDITARRGGIDGLCHAFNLVFDARPAGCGQHNNGDCATCEVLLVAEILVGRNQNRKAAFLGLLQQVAIFQIVPTKLEGRRDLMRCEVLAKRDWSPLVEKNAHLRCF